MEIYFKYVDDETEAIAEITSYSTAAADSIEAGGPHSPYGGFRIKSKNGYIFCTTGGVVYGFIKRRVFGGTQTCAILGFHREGSLTKSLNQSYTGWIKTTVFDWVENIQTVVDGACPNIIIEANFKSPIGASDPNYAI